MKYMGSKAKVARYIVPIIQEQIERSGYETYLEPFCGGCNVIDKIEAPQRIASDCNKYLIALMQPFRQAASSRATSSARNTPKSEPTATTTRNGTQAMSVLWLRIMADFSTAATLARLRQPEDSVTIRTRAGATSRRSGTS